MKITPQDQKFLRAMKIDADLPDSVSPRGQNDAVFAELVAAEVAADNWKRVAEMEKTERVHLQHEVTCLRLLYLAWRAAALVTGVVFLLCSLIWMFR